MMVQIARRNRNRMINKIWELMHEEDTVIFFDIDGLTSYNYGEYHAHHYIQGHDMDRIFCISREPHGHEAWKSEMVERLYGIPTSHCYYTLDASEKPKIVKGVVKRFFPNIEPGRVICIDDNDETLGMYMKETPFCTAHPMIFMEHLED